MQALLGFADLICTCLVNDYFTNSMCDKWFVLCEVRWFKSQFMVYFT